MNKSKLATGAPQTVRPNPVAKNAIGLSILATALAIGSPTQSYAVVGQALQISGTNLVLSWPSQGYEHYQIQTRPSLDPSTPWTVLADNYPANSTTRTTYTIYGVVSPLVVGGGGGSNTNPPPPVPSGSTMLATTATDTVGVEDLWAAPRGGTGSSVPLLLYPPGFDLTDFVITTSDGATVDVEDPTIAALLYQALIPASEDAALAAPPFVPSRGRGHGPMPSDSQSGPVDPGYYRVFHIPDWTFDVTAYTYEGANFFPVDFADYMDRVDDIQVYLNGQPTPESVFMPYVFSNGQTNWGMGIHFELYPSGTYQLQLVTTIRLSDAIGDDGTYLVLSNLSRTIVVDNEVTFANWDDLIQSTNCTFQAQTKNHNTDWWIDIYDYAENYVNGGSGHTSNGQISWVWNLTDTSGNPRDDLSADPFFYSYITFTDSARAQTTRATPAKQTAYPTTGSWLFTYLDRHYLEAGTNYPGVQSIMTSAITALRGGPSYRGVPSSVFALAFGTNTYSQQQRNDSYATLKGYMFSPVNRNLYYYGHASSNYLGCDLHTFNATNGNISGGAWLPGSKAYLSSQNVSNELTFNRYAGSRPYRFVWLDGCESANGRWPGAFGVDKANYDIDHYTNSVSNPLHRRPSAFVGWNQVIGGDGWGSAQSFFNFRTEWMQQWYYYWQSEGLWKSLMDARQNANWPPNGESQLRGAIRVFGYTNLLMNGYNQKNDWRWP